MSEDVWLTLQDAAAYLGISRQYAYQMRYLKKGPHSEKREVHADGPGPRARICYLKSDLDKWDAERKAKEAKKKEKKKKSKATAPKKSKTKVRPADVAEAA